MIAVVAVDENWGIGRDGELLFSIPEDIKFFRELTENKVVVMGRGTFMSLPGSNPLESRVNIVLSRNSGFMPESVIVCRSVEEFLTAAGRYDPDDVIVIGGQEIYDQLLDYCSAVYVTKIKKRADADRHFPNIDLSHNWKIDYKSGEKIYNGFKYTFYKYINTDVNPNCQAAR